MSYQLFFSKSRVLEFIYNAYNALHFISQRKDSQKSTNKLKKRHKIRREENRLTLRMFLLFGQQNNVDWMEVKFHIFHLNLERNNLLH